MSRQSAVMIRQVGRSSVLEHDLLLLESLNVITDHNTLLYKQLGAGTARAATATVGKTHAILGPQVDLDGLTVCPYQLNETVP